MVASLLVRIKRPLAGRGSYIEYAILAGALLLLLSSIVLSVGSVLAATSTTMNYSAQLTDKSDIPITSPTIVQFSLYNHPTDGDPTGTLSEGGPLLWTETYSADTFEGNDPCEKVTPDVDGSFSKKLGNCVPLPSYLKADSTYYIGVRVGVDSEANPRMPLASSKALSGGAPLVFGGDTDNSFETTFVITDPTGDNFITFPDDSGTVVLADEDGEVQIEGNLSVGTATSPVETLDNPGFSLDGDDLFVADSAGIEGTIYSDSGLTVGASTTYADGSITLSSGTDLNIDSGTLFIDNANNRVGIGTTSPGGLLGLKNSNTYLNVDGGNNLTFTDVVTGTKTLAELVAVGTLTDLTDTNITTPASGHVLIWDGVDSWDNKALSGDITIDNTGLTTIGADTVVLATDTTGNYVATIADFGSGFFSVAGSGAENAAVTLDIVNNSLNFAQFSDALALDATTTTTLGANNLVFNLDSTGTFDIQDGGTSAFFVNNDGNVGIGVSDPDAALEVNGAIKIDNTVADGGNITFASSGYDDWEMDNYSGRLRISKTGATGEFFNLTSAGLASFGDASPDNLLDLQRYGDAILSLTALGGNYDTVIEFELNENNPAFSMGVDDGDGDKFKIGVQTINDNTMFTIDPEWITNEGAFVGINTENPTVQLHVRGGDSINSELVLFLEPDDWDASGDYGEIRFGDTNHYIRGEWGNGMQFYDTSKFSFMGSNVGIGTASPDYKLQVNGDVVPETNLIHDLGTSALRWDNVYADSIIANDIGGTINPGLTQGSVVFAAADGSLTEDNNFLFYDDTNNRLGIGDASPDNILDIQHGGGNAILSLTALGGNYDPFIEFEVTENFPSFAMGVDDGDGDKFKIGGGTINEDTSLTIDREWAGIDGSFVGINTEDPTTNLHIKGGDTSGQSVAEIRLEPNKWNTNDVALMWFGSGYDYYMQVVKGSGIDFEAPADEPFTFSSSVYIGTVNNYRKLSVRDENTSDPVANFRNTAGYCEIDPTNTSLICSSDERLKNNILTLDNSLEKIMGLRGVSFEWISQSDGDRHLGFIAQEVQEVIPEMVFEGEDGFLTVGSNMLLPILTNAIQEQQVQIEALAESVEFVDLGDAESDVELLDTMGVDLDAVKIQIEELNTRMDEVESQPAVSTTGESQLSAEEVIDKADLGILAQVNYRVWSFSEGLVFKARARFEDSVEFLANVIFRGKVTFEDQVAVGSDTAGRLTIPQGETKVKVTFGKEYETAPIVNLTLVGQAEVDYALEEVTVGGFTVSISLAQDADITFNWLAVEGDGKETKVDVVGSEEAPEASVEGADTSSSPTPTPSSTPEEVLEPRVQILDSELGYVRVRSEPTTSSEEVGQARPGEILYYEEAQGGWYYVEYNTDSWGWVSGTYATEIN